MLRGLVTSLLGFLILGTVLAGLGYAFRRRILSWLQLRADQQLDAIVRPLGELLVAQSRGDTESVVRHGADATQILLSWYMNARARQWTMTAVVSLLAAAAGLGGWALFAQQNALLLRQTVQAETERRTAALGLAVTLRTEVTGLGEDLVAYGFLDLMSKLLEVEERAASALDGSSAAQAKELLLTVGDHTAFQLVYDQLDRLPDDLARQITLSYRSLEKLRVLLREHIEAYESWLKEQARSAPSPVYAWDSFWAEYYLHRNWQAGCHYGDPLSGALVMQDAYRDCLRQTEDDGRYHPALLHELRSVYRSTKISEAVRAVGKAYAQLAQELDALPSRLDGGRLTKAPQSLIVSTTTSSSTMPFP